MSKVPIRVIAVLQIVGGLFSMVFIGWALVAQIRDIFSVGIGIGEMLVDIFGVVAGIMLWSGTSFGRKASVAIQAIQLPKIISPSLVFMFSFGFDFWVHASSSAFGFQTAFFGNNQIFIGVGVQNVPVDFGVSVTAIIALVILNKYKPAARTSVGPLPPPPPNDWPASEDRAPNKSLDRSGGSVFCNLIRPARLA
jgi:hypothetical protein